VKREPRGPSVKIGSELPMIPGRSMLDEVASWATAGAAVPAAMPTATVRDRRVLRMGVIVPHSP